MRRLMIEYRFPAVEDHFVADCEGRPLAGASAAAIAHSRGAKWCRGSEQASRCGMPRRIRARGRQLAPGRA